MYFVAKLFPSFLIAFLAGVFLASFFLSSPWYAYMLLFLAGALVPLFVVIKKERRILFVFMCMIGCACGILRFILWDQAPTDAALDARIGEKVLLTGLVSDEPDVRETGVHLTITLDHADTPGAPQAVFGKLLLSVPRYPEYHYGDVLELSGKLSLPKTFTEDDGRVFDYPSYLRSKGIRYQMAFATVKRRDEGRGNIIVATLFHIKEKFIVALGSVLPEPHHALMGGLLLGGKQSLGTEWTDRFRAAGIIHIVVLSGYNMTVIATSLVKFFRFFGFFGSLAVGALGIILFAIMTGGGATVLRAMLMALLALVARASGRTSDMGRALLLAGACMVLQNPSILAFDPSFQLSFLASLGLVFVVPFIERWKLMHLFQQWPTIHEILVSTLGTQIAVLPLLLHQTGMLSLVALPANLLVLPLIPITMFLGFIAGLVALVSSGAGFFFALPSYCALSWILGVADVASRIPFAVLHVGAFSGMLTFAAYVLLGGYIFFCHRKSIRA